MRRIVNLNDNWHFDKVSEVPATLPTNWEMVNLPHTWNAKDGQDGRNDYWRGTAMYAKMFARPERTVAQREYLEFLGAAMTADVYPHGKPLAHHEGGYSTFRVEITEHLQEVNLLCVAVDNSNNDRVYPQKADFTFYGGLYRSVNLVLVPGNHFELCKDDTPGIKVTPIEDAQCIKSVANQLKIWYNKPVRNCIFRRKGHGFRAAENDIYRCRSGCFGRNHPEAESGN